jgi:hypothetical protein
MSIKSNITSAIVVATVAVPAGSAFARPAIDSPASSPATIAQDLRSPDARDAADQAAIGQDLRSPDARDAADQAAIGQAVHETAQSSSDGFPWLETGLAGAVVLSLLGVGAATMRRRHRVPASA